MRLHVIGLSVLSVFLGVSFAKVRTVDLNYVISRVLAHNSDIKAAERTAATAAVSWRKAKAEYLPDVSANASLSHQTSGVTSSISPQAGSIDVSADMTLFNGGGTAATINQTHSTWMASTNTLEAERQTVVYNAFIQYVGTLQDSDIVRLDEENLAMENQSVAQIEAFTKSGTKSRADLLSQQSEAAQAELTLLNARYNYEISKLTLMKMLCEDTVGVAFQVARLLPDSNDIALGITNDSILSIAITRRQDIAAQRNTLQASEYAIKSAKSAYWPTLSLSAGVSSAYNSSPDSAIGDVSKQLFDNNAGFSVGASLSIPIFDRFSTRYGIETAAISKETQQANLDDLKRQVMFDVQQAMLAYTLAQQQIPVTDIEVESAKQALDAEQACYNVGAATHVDLIEAQVKHATAVIDRVKAIYSLAMKAVGVGYYAGTINSVLDMYLKNSPRGE